MEINEHMHAHFEDLRTPVSVFITFESEEGYNRALSIKENKLDVKWMDQTLNF